MKRIIAVLLLITLLIGACFALASGGTATNPLINLKYLADVFSPALHSEIDTKLADYSNQLVTDGTSALQQRVARYTAWQGLQNGSVSYHETFQSFRLKKGDTLTVLSGSGIMLLAGESALVGQMTLLDVSAGTRLSGGNALAIRSRYLAADTVNVVITSDTAVISIEGFFSTAPSDELDYQAVADALNALELFRGSDIAYGNGYELERAPTRIEGLVMFLRLIGEEEQALRFVGEAPFVDVASWSSGYVAYAYEKGYTNGVGLDGAGQAYFAPNQTISAGEYLTFLLRALGYRDSGEQMDFQWNTALLFAKAQELISGGEYALLAEGDFLRAQVAYLSYFSLDIKLKDGTTTLANRLISNSIFTKSKLDEVRGALSVQRIL